MILPSGRRVSFSSAGDPVRRSPQDPVFSELFTLEAQGRLSLTESLLQFSLADFHVARALAMHAGLILEDEEEVACRNCGGRTRVRPCAHLPVGPFEEGALSDPELDWLLPLPTEVPSPAGTFRLLPRTVGEAMPLFRMLRRRRPVLSLASVSAMGIVQTGVNPREVARRVRELPDEAWEKLLGAYHEAHYSRRLVGIFACRACGARCEVDAPFEREFLSRSERSEKNERPFVTFDAFDAAAREHWGLLDGHAGVLLVVDEGVPACDESGEPLLGSYVPAHEGGDGAPTRAAEVAVYFRTFRAAHEEDPSFSWNEELRETLEHELLHHQGALRGHDPMDEEEHAAIDEEAERIYGKRTLLRSEVRSFAQDVSEFVQRTWILWLILVLLCIAVLLQASGGSS